MIEVVDLEDERNLFAPFAQQPYPQSLLRIGFSKVELSPDAARISRGLDFTIAPGGPDSTWIAVDDPAQVVSRVRATVVKAPRATHVLRSVLAINSELTVTAHAVHNESHAYSMLLAGPEFQQWREGHPAQDVPPAAENPVLVQRNLNTLTLTLNRPERRNAYGRAVRDNLVEGLELAVLDDSITRVELRGNGRSFSSGGDLDEFGTAPDPVSAHHARTTRHAGLLLSRLGWRAHAFVQGPCIGAGVEIPAFAATVHADTSAWFKLPELAMGLIPGAGGTVSLVERIGRHRTAYLALTQNVLDAYTAHEWGLVDELH